jgi:hypothetical protein
MKDPKKEEAIIKIKKFSKQLEKNINNFIPSISLNDPTKPISSYFLKIDSIYGVKKTKKNLSGKNNFFLRFNLNFFNTKTFEFFGNTYKSPYLKVKINETSHYELAETEPLYIYFLTNLDPTIKNQVMLIFEILLVEIAEDNRVVSQTCEGWGMLEIDDHTNTKGVTADVYLGTPRNLLYNNMKSIIF